jgi:hypothetical protein
MKRPLLAGFAMAISAWLSVCPDANAQNPCCIIVEPADTNVTVMRSGTELSLQTRTRPVFFPPDPWSFSISFSFGFATFEVPLEGEIFDSVTLVMENTNSGVAAVLFTADANGFTWLPDTPGLLPLREEDLDFVAAAVPEDIQPMPPLRLSYQVTFAVPRSLGTNWTDLTLVLFDYPNGLNSVGWLGPVTVIPPPGVLEVGVTGLFRSIGPIGGSFLPASQTRTLTNSGGQTLSWQATSAATWLTVSPGSGQLEPGRATNVTVSVNSRARSFGPGIYHTQVTFANASLVTNSFLHPVELIVAAGPVLEAMPPQIPGEFRLRLRATPLTMYRIEASGDFDSWTPVHTNSTALDGTFLYAEPAPRAHRFFRALFVNP